MSDALEREVRTRFVDGESTEAIAAALGLSVTTITAMVTPGAALAAPAAPAKPVGRKNDARAWAALRIPARPRMISGSRSTPNEAIAAHVYAGGKVIG